MAKMSKESIERFFDNHIHVETRTIFLGDGDEGEIDAVVSEGIIKAFHILTNTYQDRPINLFINSFGGCWFNGMAVYDVIKACPCVVNAYVVGAAMSMGSIILQAADMRYIYPNATIMVHDGYETHVNELPQNFMNWAEYSKKTRASMYKIYAQRSGRPTSFWRKKCTADLILTAQEAKEMGLVDAIYGQDES